MSRDEGPREDVPPPDSEFKAFVGGISWHMNDRELKESKTHVLPGAQVSPKRRAPSSQCMLCSFSQVPRKKRFSDAGQDDRSLQRFWLRVIRQRRRPQGSSQEHA